jgi:hypothetical protein
LPELLARGAVHGHFVKVPLGGGVFRFGAAGLMPHVYQPGISHSLKQR